MIEKTGRLASILSMFFLLFNIFYGSARASEKMAVIVRMELVDHQSGFYFSNSGNIHAQGCSETSGDNLFSNFISFYPLLNVPAMQENPPFNLNDHQLMMQRYLLDRMCSGTFDLASA